MVCDHRSLLLELQVSLFRKERHLATAYEPARPEPAGRCVQRQPVGAHLPGFLSDDLDLVTF